MAGTVQPIIVWIVLHLHYLLAIAVSPSTIRFNSLELPIANHNFCSWSFTRTYYVEIQHWFSTSLTHRSCEEISETECIGRVIKFNSKFLRSKNIELEHLESIVSLTIQLKDVDLPYPPLNSTLKFKLQKNMQTHHNYELSELNNNISLSIHFLKLWPNSMSIEASKTVGNGFEKNAEICVQNNQDHIYPAIHGELFSFSEETIRKLMAESNQNTELSESPSNENLKQPINWSSVEHKNVNKRSVPKIVNGTSSQSSVETQLDSTNVRNIASDNVVSSSNISNSTESNILRMSELLHGNSTLVMLISGSTPVPSYPLSPPPPSSTSLSSSSSSTSHTSEKKLSLGDIVFSSGNKSVLSVLSSSPYVTPVTPEPLFQAVSPSVATLHTQKTSSKSLESKLFTPNIMFHNISTSTVFHIKLITNSVRNLTITTTTTPTPTTTAPTTTPTTTTPTITTATATTPTTTATTTTAPTPPTSPTTTPTKTTTTTTTAPTTTTTAPTTPTKTTTTTKPPTTTTTTTAATEDGIANVNESSTISISDSSLVNSTGGVEKEIALSQNIVKKSFKSDGILWPIVLTLVVVIPVVIVVTIACCVMVKKRNIDPRSFFLSAIGKN